jgi:hypothetical protein
VYKIVMKLISEKIRSRIHLHSTLESLHNHIDKSTLPLSLGGTLTEDEAINKEFVERVLNANKPYEGTSKLKYKLHSTTRNIFST